LAIIHSLAGNDLHLRYGQKTRIFKTRKGQEIIWDGKSNTEKDYLDKPDLQSRGNDALANDITGHEMHKALRGLRWLLFKTAGNF
jgi:hypothetical protein